ncbi:MAG: hypothetical protein IJZ74_03580 [Clostridia bacterium]|nr:hypothetical protein [Clostridia bacterium]
MTKIDLPASKACGMSPADELRKPDVAALPSIYLKPTADSSHGLSAFVCRLGKKSERSGQYSSGFTPAYGDKAVHNCG